MKKEKRSHDGLMTRTGGESGNVLLALFGAIGAIAIIGGSATMFMRGPIKTMSEVNQTTMIEGHIAAAAKMVMLDVETLNAGTGDCDEDRVIEPRAWRDPGANPAPTGGGHIPNEIGSLKRDPWGTPIGYCVWDHGAIVDGNGCAGQNRLLGTNKRDYPTLAIISAGANGTFETTCRDWVDVAPVDGLPDQPLFEATSDDVYVVYTYAEAVEETPSIWREASPDVWSLGVDSVTGEIEVVANDDVEFSGSEIFAPTRMEMVGDLGLLLPDDTALPTCDASTEGQIRRNMSGASPVMELCAGGVWEEVTGTAGSGGGGSGGGSGPGTGALGPTDGLVAYWRLDETSGNVIYDYIGENNGLWTDGADNDVAGESVDAAVSTGLDFATSTYVVASDALDAVTEITVSLWTRISPTTASSFTHYILSQPQDGIAAPAWRLFVDQTNAGFTVGSAPASSTTYSTTRPVLDRWVHIAGTFDGTTIRYYLDGIFIGSAAHAGGIVESAENTAISFNGAQAFEGEMDDVRIYSRALSDAEIRELYSRTNYIAQATVTQPAAHTGTIGTTGWVTTLASDTAGDEAGIAFKVDLHPDNHSLPSAAIVASRMADPARVNLLFNTFDGSTFDTRMVIGMNGGLLLDNTPQGTPDSILQIGDHFTTWNANYYRGLLVSEDELSYFGDNALNDAGTQLLFSKILKIQNVGTDGTGVREYLRFESTPKVTAFGDLVINNPSTDVAFRVQNFGSASVFEFKRASSGAVAPSEQTGQILFQGYESGFPADGHASIRAFVNGTVAADSVPTDIVFGVSATGAASMNEGLRITSAGNVGVGKAAPEAKFHVAGRLQADEGVKIGADTTCAAAADSGTLAYNSGTFELCDGTTLNAVGGAPAAADICDPIPFDFLDRDDLTANTVFETNTVIVGGIQGSCTLIATSDSSTLTVVKNGVDQAGQIVGISNGDALRLKIRSSSSNAGYVKTVVNLGRFTDEVYFQSVGKIVFVSSIDFEGTLDQAFGLEGAHLVCRYSADGAGLNGNFLAWLADDTGAPASHFRQYANPYYLPNGTKVADNWTDLTDGTLDSAINRDENNTVVASGNVWTATDTAGVLSAGTEDCTNWSSQSGNGRFGDLTSAAAAWASSGTVSCSTNAHVYCFEQ